MSTSPLYTFTAQISPGNASRSSMTTSATWSPITLSFSPNFSQIPLASATALPSVSASASPSTSFSFSAYTTMPPMPSPTPLWSPALPSYSSQPQPQPQSQPKDSNGLSTNSIILLCSILGVVVILSIINAIYYNQKYKLEKKKRVVEFKSSPLHMHSQVRGVLPS
jgi:hypothetical protein